jgi:schlafen family protein
MTIPATHDLLALLDRLESATADDLETQWLDFKPWQGGKDDMKVAVEYAACFATGEGGVVVFGVADRTRGRAKAIHGASGYDLDTWRRGIFDSTRPNLAVEVEELRVPEGTGRLLVGWRGEGREMGLDGLLILSFLRDHAFIDTLSAAKLLQLSREETRATLDRLAQPETGFLERPSCRKRHPRGVKIP